MIAPEPILNTLIPEERGQRFTQLYEGVFPSVARFVANRGGSFQDAKDIFHDALVILYEKMVFEKFSPDSSEELYLVGIAKHLWLRKAKDDHRKTPLDEMEESFSIPEEYFDSSENRLTSLLELTGRRCMELLRAFYYDNLPMQKIRQVFGFSNVHSTSVQKFKCIEKMRNVIQQKSLDYDDFA
jgi:RNA polymerase sigma factor (sigma-70 family)